jgi:hypothetical protein
MGRDVLTPAQVSGLFVVSKVFAVQQLIAEVAELPHVLHHILLVHAAIPVPEELPVQPALQHAVVQAGGMTAIVTWLMVVNLQLLVVQMHVQPMVQKDVLEIHCKPAAIITQTVVSNGVAMRTVRQAEICVVITHALHQCVLVQRNVTTITSVQQIPVIILVPAQRLAIMHLLRIVPVVQMVIAAPVHVVLESNIMIMIRHAEQILRVLELHGNTLHLTRELCVAASVKSVIMVFVIKMTIASVRRIKSAALVRVLMQRF